MSSSPSQGEVLFAGLAVILLAIPAAFLIGMVGRYSVGIPAAALLTAVALVPRSPGLVVPRALVLVAAAICIATTAIWSATV